jgi:transcription initiation factor TFIIIB Brf1 subunit/transcription initiation factor TFIIB
MCLKGKKTAPAEAGNYVCGKCGAVAEKKGKLCKPEEIKGKKSKKDKKKDSK